MQNDPSEVRTFAYYFAKKVIGDVAPDEIDAFDELAQDYYQNPDQSASANRGESDDALGFGLEEALIAFTPAVLAAAGQVFNYLLNQATDALKEEGGQALRRRIAAAFTPKPKQSGKPSAPAPASQPPAPVSPPQRPVQKAPPDFSRDQLSQMKQIALRELRKNGLPAPEAERVANAMVVKLAMI